MLELKHLNKQSKSLQIACSEWNQYLMRWLNCYYLKVNKMLNKFLIGGLLVTLIGCSNRVDCTDCDDSILLSHSCPEVGHGPCYLCDAPTIAKK